MKLEEIEALDHFLEQSFKGDIYTRELRLSVEEVAYVLQKFSKAHITKMDTSSDSEGKNWYQVDLIPVSDHEDLVSEDKKDNEQHSGEIVISK